MQCIVMYAAGILSCPQSVLRHKFEILYTYHLDTLYLHEQGCEDPLLFFEAKRGPRAKKNWETLIVRGWISILMNKKLLIFNL